MGVVFGTYDGLLAINVALGCRLWKRVGSKSFSAGLLAFCS